MDEGAYKDKFYLLEQKRINMKIETNLGKKNAERECESENE